MPGNGHASDNFLLVAGLARDSGPALVGLSLGNGHRVEDPMRHSGPHMGEAAMPCETRGPDAPATSRRTAAAEA